MKIYPKLWGLKITTLLILSSINTQVNAQISSDGSLSTKVNTMDNLNFSIEEGDRSGNNIFHSFKDFSIPTNGSAFFNNAIDVQNIFSRVTGGNISNLDGFLGANGTANLFLLNPQGVIFGPNANLGLGGSLVVTSAESLKFADGTVFSVGMANTTPILTQSTPIGLQYGNNPGAIVNQSLYTPPPFPPFPSRPVGLQLAEGKTIALLGGKIKNEGGYINASAGRIELGALDSNASVSLTPVKEGFTVGYEGVSNFQDITINNSSIIDVSSLNPFLPSGSLQVQGKNVVLAESSQLSSFSLFDLPAGNLVLNASESVEIIGNLGDSFGDTNVTTSTFSNGDGGSIVVNTKRLKITSGGNIVTNTVIFDNPEVTGKGGNLLINASEAIEISGLSLTRSSALSVETYTFGQGGELTVNTPQLLVKNGGTITAQTFSQGDGGTINIKAQNVEVTDSAIDFDGTLIPSSIKANTEGAGNAGNLNITTNILKVNNNGSITVSGTSTGAAGNLEIKANNITLDQGGSLSAETTAGDKGSINLNVSEDLVLRNNSSITTEATGEASGGNINLNTEFLVGLNDSDIIANAVLGSGGNIQINASSIFLSPDSTITASSQFGVDGIVDVNTPDVQLDSALAELKASFIPAEQIIASSCVSRQNAERGRFVITGTGGLPYSPYDAMRGYYSITSVESISGEGNLNSTVPSTPSTTAWQPGQPIQEAQGITVTAEGKVFLGSMNQVAQPSELICP